MIYPLIILGAGASHDSIDNHNRFSNERRRDLDKNKPPITDKIFDRTKFDHILKDYQEAKELSGETHHRINKNYSLEDLMTDILNNRAEKNPIWYSRLMSFRLYLQRLFHKISEVYFDESNNYYSLLSEIGLYSENRACFVNFNYDLLLERNIKNIGMTENIDDYIGGNIKVIKIHGACNWFRSFERGYKTDGDFKGGRDYLMFNAQRIIKKENNLERINSRLFDFIIKNDFSNWDFYENDSYNSDEVLYYIPNIALPMNGKDSFVCPDKHIQELKNRLKEINRIIIIGWKGADEFLLNTLKEELRGKNIPVFIVSPNADKTKERIIKDYDFRHNFKIFSIKQKFSDFLRSNNNNCGKVLSIENPNEVMKKLIL
jgi:hypothetical protein